LSRTQSAPQSQSAPQCQSSVSCETTLPRFAQALEGLKALFEHGVAASYTLPPVQCSSAKELALVERGTEREREIGGRGRGRGRRARAHSLSLSHARAQTDSLTHSQSFSLFLFLSLALSPLSPCTHSCGIHSCPQQMGLGVATSNALEAPGPRKVNELGAIRKSWPASSAQRPLSLSLSHWRERERALLAHTQDIGFRAPSLGLPGASSSGVSGRYSL